jgi:hypothetical protein
VGLITGIGLPHLAALVTIFAFVLIWLFDSRPACRVRVEDLPKDRLAECAQTYRGAMEGQGCRIISERRYSRRGRVDFVMRLPSKASRDSVDAVLASLPPDVRGDVAWRID